MDGVYEVLGMLKNQAIIVVLVLSAIALYYYASRVWISPESASPGMILGSGLVIVGAGFYALLPQINMLAKRELLFILLFCWSALGLMFFAGRTTSKLKITFALFAQASIIYSLFLYT